MDAKQRREKIQTLICESDKPLSATALANICHVSRQIVVGDVALLRAGGKQIIATPRGYLCESHEQDYLQYTIAVSHKADDLAKELYTIVDLGGILLDVIVEHPLYGQLNGQLHITSRYDADQFLKKVEEHEVKPLSNLTDGLHLHTIQCPSEEVFQRIEKALQALGFLYQK